MSIISDTRLDQIADPLLDQAIREVASTYGDKISISAKRKSLLKFGRNQAVGTSSATIMTLPSGVTSETYLNSNTITTISSSSLLYDQAITLEGHTIDGSGDLTFSIQIVTLDGRNQVTLGTPLARCTRIYNNDSTELAGTIYVYQSGDSTNGVPDESSEVHCMIRAGKQQSEKASTSISSQDYWILTSIYITVLERSNTVYADTELQIRRPGGVFRASTNIGAKSGDLNQLEFKPYLIVPKNCDIRLQAEANTGNVDVAGGITGFLASVES